MGRSKTLVSVYGSLSPADAKRLKEMASVQKKAPAAVAREALKWYLDNQDKLDRDKRESELEKRLRKMEERMASLGARTAIDVGMIYHLIYRNMDMEKRDDVIAWAYKSAVERLKKKLTGGAVDVKELMQKREDNGDR